MRKYRKYLILFVLTALGFGIIYFLPSAVTAMSPLVETTILDTQDISITVRCNGIIENPEQQKITVEMPIYVESLAVAEGDRVEAGDLLFTVDEAATKQTVALLAGISQESQDEWLSADASLTESLLTTRIPDGIYAPSSGIISDLQVKPGELLMPEEAAMLLSSDESGMCMRASFSESIVSSVESGQRAKITGNGFKNKVYRGVVESLSDSAKQVVRTTGTDTVVEGIIRLEEAYDGILRAGYNAQAEIETGVHENALLLPYEAIAQDENNQKYIYQFIDGWAYKRYIQTGTETTEGLEILEGAEKGWEIVLNPERLEGNNIRVITR